MISIRARRVRRWGIALIAVLLASCLGQSASGPEDDDQPPPNALKVLFIGNSLTYVNDLPAILAALADSAQVTRPLWYRTATYPNYSLEDHLLDGRARTALEDRAWDVVVLQQGPSSLPENQILLRDWTVQFEPLIRGAGAQPALYMVWPEAVRQSAFDAVATAYANAALAVDGMLFPVGRAWQEAWKLDPVMPLYGGDGFHPSLTGSWLAALVMLDRLYTVSIEDLPATIRTRYGARLSIPAGLRANLITAAKEANQNFGR